MLYCFIENLNNKVFLADGARWIWNWVADSYPDSVQIVDYFHAKEHLCEFAGGYFKDSKEGQKWVDRYSKQMLNQGITPIIRQLKGLQQNRDSEKLRKLMGYYKENQKRMQYHIFRKKGLLIGSGAIEAAHKDVLQKRLKLSGQRWTKEGLQQMAQLRAAYKSGEQNRIRNLCALKAA